MPLCCCLWPRLPQTQHPVTGQTYAQHWQDYDKNKQKLWPVTFMWRGENLTKAD